MKKTSIVTIIVMVVLAILMLSMCTGGGGSGGDGKNTCRNCGRSKPLSSMGYCSTCQEGFNDWQDRYYGND